MYSETLKPGCELNIKDYKIIFSTLYEEHNSYCKRWLFNNNNKINLKRTCICDIYSSNKGFEEIFKEYIDSYLIELPCLYSKIMERIHNECGFFIGGRTKNFTSIIYKVNNKCKQQNGKFPISKCLNDLLGFRIIDNNYNDNIKDIKTYVKYLREYKYKNRIRYIDSDNGDYKGDHIYFLGDSNKFFPIELQIWNYENEKGNLESHKKYKQDYLKWLNDYNYF